MNSRIKNILIFVGALIIGMVMNFSVLEIMKFFIPDPKGFDLNTMEGLIKAMPFMTTKNFIGPFLAHAVGTLVGAVIVKRFAFENASRYSFGIGFFNLLAGISMIFSIPTPFWFEAIDLIFAYLPMAWLANKMVSNRMARN
jgi:hypothetical protein